MPRTNRGPQPLNGPVIINGYNGDAVFRSAQGFSTISQRLAKNLPKEKVIDEDGREINIVTPLVTIHGTKPFSIRFSMRIFEESIDDLVKQNPLFIVREEGEEEKKGCDVQHEVILAMDFWKETKLNFFGGGSIRSSLFGTLLEGDMDRFVKDCTNCDYSKDPDERVILLFDMECFEVQVYEKPNQRGFPRVVVNSRNRITAASYEAKQLGINRESTPHLSEAQKIFPNVIPIKMPSRLSVAGLSPEPNTKVARLATEKIKAAVIKELSHYPDGTTTFQFSSNDEFYVEVTVMVNCLQNQCGLPDLINYFHHESCSNTFLYNECVSGVANKDYVQQRLTELDRKKSDLTDLEKQEVRLIIGAQIADVITNIIRKETTYESSVGVSSKVLISKIGSGLHKPGSITILAPSGFQHFTNIVKIDDIPGLRGTTGEAVKKEFDISTMKELGMVRTLMLADVVINPGDTQPLGLQKAKELLALAYGLDDTPVVPQNCFASIGVTSTFGQNGRCFSSHLKIVTIVKYLITELVEKLELEKTFNSRTPSKLELTIERLNAGNINSLIELQPGDASNLNISYELFRRVPWQNATVKVKGISVTANF